MLIDLSGYSSLVTSLSYDVTNSSILYVGFSDGIIRRYNTMLNEFDHSFHTGYGDPVSTIINHSDFLIAEQINAENQIQHAFFRRQFEGVKLQEKQGKKRLNQHIDGITGATRSGRAMKQVAKVALFLQQVAHAPTDNE